MKNALESGMATMNGLLPWKQFIKRFKEHRQKNTEIPDQPDRAYNSVKQLIRLLRSGDTVLELGCLPAFIPVAMDAAGILDKVQYYGTCVEDESDFQYVYALSLGIKLLRLNLDPLYALPSQISNLSNSLDIQDGTIDLVIMAEVMEHLVWPHSALAEVARVLKHEGSLWGSTPNATDIGLVLRALLGIRAFTYYDCCYLSNTPDANRADVRYYDRGEIKQLLRAHGLVLSDLNYHSDIDPHVSGSRAKRLLRNTVRKLTDTIPWWRQGIYFVARRV